jgi:hypothetical protein
MTTALACMNDLMFLSKIVEAAKALSCPLRSVKTAERLVDACREGDSAVVFLDLDDQRLDAVVLAQAIRSAAPPVEDRIKAAAPGLFDQVFSRGQFVRILPELLGASRA